MANAIVTTRDTQLEKQRISKNAISLTNFSNTAEPAIAAGSVVEIGGSVFVVTSDEAITGWAGIGNDTDCYIKLVADVADFAAEFTTDAPTWSHSKQGWYDGGDRFVAVLHRGATAADYESKGIIPGVQGNRFSSLEIARNLNVQRDADIDGDLNVDGDADIIGDIATHERVLANWYTCGASTMEDLGDALGALTPTDSQQMLASGIVNVANGETFIVGSLVNHGGGSVVLYGYDTSDDTNYTLSLAAHGADPIIFAGISW